MDSAINIVIGSDHAGFSMKEDLLNWLMFQNYLVENVGCFNQQRCDYPDYAKQVANIVSASEAVGILVCGTGLGMAMAANRHKNVRAAAVTNCALAQATREHNNANVLCLGARIVTLDLAKSIVQTFLTALFEGGRHTQRVDGIEL